MRPVEPILDHPLGIVHHRGCSSKIRHLLDSYQRLIKKDHDEFGKIQWNSGKCTVQKQVILEWQGKQFQMDSYSPKLGVLTLIKSFLESF